MGIFNYIFPRNPIFPIKKYALKFRFSVKITLQTLKLRCQFISEFPGKEGIFLLNLPPFNGNSLIQLKRPPHFYTLQMIFTEKRNLLKITLNFGNLPV